MGTDSLNIYESHPTAFCIKIDFEKNTENPSRIFKTMTALIETLQTIDQALVESIDSKIKTIAMMEDVEAGSLKTWLINALESVDDDALKTLDWKRAVGKYLVEGKSIVLDFLRGKTKISNRSEIERLENKLLSLAEETDVRHFPAYVPIKRDKLLPALGNITDSLKGLTKNDLASYIYSGKEIPFNADFEFIPDEIEDLLTQKTITNKSILILKVKKPDYLGESQWEFKYDGRSLMVKILDEDWLKDFQSRKREVRPGDSLRAEVEINTKYGYDGEVVGVHYKIIIVKEILKNDAGDQSSLQLPEKNGN